MPEQSGVGGRCSHSVQLCVPFRMVLRAGVEVEGADANADVLGEPRTMLETFGRIAKRGVTVRGRKDGWPRENCGLPRMSEIVRGRNGLASESS